MSYLSRLTVAAAALAAMWAAPVLAEEANSEGAALWAQAVHGPTSITLKDQAVLKLPEGYVYMPKEPAAKLMEKMGNKTDDRFLGLIFPESEEAGWLVDIEYEPSGYVKDDDAKDWDADELLTSLKEGTQEANKDRAARGISELEVTGWAQAPKYDSSSHQLVWSLLAREKGAPADASPVVNYNTYALGREGYVSLNLITDAAHVEAEKSEAKMLLGALNFNEGKRYQDFNASTDKVAEYGLAALVAGVAAKKLGFFALAAAFFAKFFKLIAVAAVAGFAGLRNIFKGRNA